VIVAGVMYWGDAQLNKIESANLDGTGRRTILTETDDTHYFAFHLYAPDFIYITDWSSAYELIYQVFWSMVKTATYQNGDRSKRRHRNGDRMAIFKTETNSNNTYSSSKAYIIDHRLYAYMACNR